MNVQVEYCMHKSFYEWCRYHHDIDQYMFAIEHGEIRNSWVGVKLKKKGVKRGMADYLFIKPNNKYNALWIEFKAAPNKQTEHQKYFEKLVTDCKQLYKCCYSVDEAISLLHNYLNDAI